MARKTSWDCHLEPYHLKMHLYPIKDVYTPTCQREEHVLKVLLAEIIALIQPLFFLLMLMRAWKFDFCSGFWGHRRLWRQCNILPFTIKRSFLL